MALNIPLSAVVFLMVVGFLLVAVAALFLFLERKWCFAGCDGFDCLRQDRLDKSRLNKEEEDLDDGSSDDGVETEQRNFRFLRTESVRAQKRRREREKQKAAGVGEVSVKIDTGDTVDASGGAAIEAKAEKDVDTREKGAPKTEESPVQAPPRSRYGQVLCALRHEQPAGSSSGRLRVSIVQARDLPTARRGGADYVRVHLTLLPSRRERFKSATQDSPNPRYEETFTFHKVATTELGHSTLRLRLYGADKSRKPQLVSEVNRSLQSLSLTGEAQWLDLVPFGSVYSSEETLLLSDTTSESGSSSAASGGRHRAKELLLGLEYNSVTGRLMVEVVKGSNLRTANGSPADSFVRFALLSPTGETTARAKTTVRRSQPHPLFRETFVFDVPHFNVPKVTLMVTACSRAALKSAETLGWFALGYNSSSTEESSHWQEMQEAQSLQTTRWHRLLTS